ncbi:PAS domain S-box protein, partial [bacterium]|nr:PAS domain S-box protein [bacterium]
MAAERRANGGAAGPAVPPRAAPWEQVFRRTEVPLFVEDIARARASIREVAAAVGTDGLRGWLDAHPDFIGRIIAEVQVIDVNDAAVRLNAAASREELLVSLDKLVLPESLPAFKDLICMLAGDARLYEGQSCYRALDGREYHTLNRADIPASDDPDQLLVIATVEITDLKATEQALVESEERYRVLVETAKDVILRHDLAGRITFLNRAGRELLGRDESDLATLTAQELLTERALPAALDRAAARRRGEDGVLLYETEYRHKGGRIVPVEVSSTLLPAALGGTGEPQVLLVARDISIRRRLQAEQDRLAGRLRDAHKNESLGVLAGGIAHDFNNLLVTILGNAEMLRADVGDGAGAPNIDAIIGAGRQAAELCRQMVAYAGTAPTEAGPGDLSEIIGGTRGLLAATVSGGAHLGFELDADLPAVAVEAARFRQAVLNLVTNANEALGTEGGEIVVRTGMRDPSGAEPAG